MKKEILIFPVLFISAIFRLFYISQTGNSLQLLSLILNIVSLFIFWFLLIKRFEGNFFLIFSAVIFLTVSPWHIYLASEGIAVNLMLVVFLIIFWLLIKVIYAYSKIIFLAALSIALFSLSPVNAGQAVYESIFSNREIVWSTEEQRREHTDSNLVAIVLHNKLTNYTAMVLNNYSKHFSGQLLFLDGDVKQEKRISEVGLIHIFDFFLLISGFICMIKKPQIFLPFLFLLILSPFPSSLIYDPQISLTAYTMVIPLSLISGAGLTFLMQYILRLKKPLYYILPVFILVFIIWDILRFLHQINFHLTVLK